MPSTTETRHLDVALHLRADAETDAREVTGIAVPYNDPIELWRDEFEQIARGACEPIDNPKLIWRHGEVIGRIVSHRDTEAGWEITARISETQLGNEAYTLLRDGVIDRMSIGFRPIEWSDEVDADKGTTLRTYTRIEVLETSLVPFPAYDNAKVQQVRSADTTKETPAMTDTAPAPELAEVRESIEDLSREVKSLALDRGDHTPTDTKFRTAGRLLKAIAAGDEAARGEYEAEVQRAYDGGTLADSVAKNGWVGDLTRLIDAGAGIRSLFETGTLPKEGAFLEYAQLKSDTTTVTEQVNEGDDLATGKVAVELKSTSVKTFGGVSSLSIQQIERSTINILDTQLRAQAIAAGKAQAAHFRAAYAAAVTAQRTANNVVTIPTEAGWADWLDAVVDAAVKYEDLGLSLDGLIVDTTFFKAFNRFTGADGRPMFTVSGTGANTVGTLDVSALSGSIANIPVRLNAKQATPGAAFYNAMALRSYTSPLAKLQDENILNLTKDFAVYFYAAVADEIPAAIVPVRVATV